jgi:hypothetical protein
MRLPRWIKSLLLVLFSLGVASAQWSAPPSAGYATLNTFLSSLSSMQFSAS